MLQVQYHQQWLEVFQNAYFGEWLRTKPEADLQEGLRIARVLGSANIEAVVSRELAWRARCALPPHPPLPVSQPRGPTPLYSPY